MDIESVTRYRHCEHFRISDFQMILNLVRRAVRNTFTPTLPNTLHASYRLPRYGFINVEVTTAAPWLHNTSAFVCRGWSPLPLPVFVLRTKAFNLLLGLKVSDVPLVVAQSRDSILNRKDNPQTQQLKHEKIILHLLQEMIHQSIRFDQMSTYAVSRTSATILYTDALSCSSCNARQSFFQCTPF